MRPLTAFFKAMQDDFQTAPNAASVATTGAAATNNAVMSSRNGNIPYMHHNDYGEKRNVNLTKRLLSCTNYTATSQRKVAHKKNVGQEGEVRKQGVFNANKAEMEFQKMRPKSVTPEKRKVSQQIDNEKRTQSANTRKQSVSFIDVNLYRNYEERDSESDDDIIDSVSEVNNRRYSTRRNDTLDIQRKISASSKSSGETFPGSKHSTKSSDGSNDQSKRRESSNTYNPDAEKAAAFLHGGGKNFSRTNTSLTPVRYAMKNLQISYSETNTDMNHGVIFFDLLKSAQKKDAIRGTSIRSLERRLKLQRINPERSTSFYENKNLHDPYRTIDKKPSRTSLQKKKDRKEKIKKTTEKIHNGYVPAFKTLKMASRKEVEDIGRYCRYLRMEPLRASPDSDHS